MQRLCFESMSEPQARRGAWRSPTPQEAPSQPHRRPTRTAVLFFFSWRLVERCVRNQFQCVKLDMSFFFSPLSCRKKGGTIHSNAHQRTNMHQHAPMQLDTCLLQIGSVHFCAVHSFGDPPPQFMLTIRKVSFLWVNANFNKFLCPHV